MNITTPTVLLNWSIAKANMQKMIDRAERHGLSLRPHFKTSQSRAIGKLCRRTGLKFITVSSLTMADYFSKDGWNDITVAFPVNVREIETINRLAKNIKLNLLVVNPISAEFLTEKLSSSVGIFIKIDVGYQRTGIEPDNVQEIEKCLTLIYASDKMIFKGFLAHAGHSYKARSEKEIMLIHDSTTAILRKLKNKYLDRFPDMLLSYGDTPTCSVAETSWGGIDEIRPGNFIFYDLMQVQIGCCKIEDIAVALACPVVAKNADRKEVLVYGGGVHLSKDRINGQAGIHVGDVDIYGFPVFLNEKGWEMPEARCYVKNVSQEHGLVKCTPSFFDKIEIGSLLGILPVHSCMMVDLADGFLTMEGEFLEKM